MAVIDALSPSERREREHQRQAPWQDAWNGMLVELSNLGMPPRIRGQASDWVTHKKWLLQFADVVDKFTAKYGDALDEHAYGLDLSLFQKQVRGALEGNATYALQRQADLLNGEAE